MAIGPCLNFYSCRIQQSMLQYPASNLLACTATRLGSGYLTYLLPIRPGTQHPTLSQLLLTAKLQPILAPHATYYPGPRPSHDEQQRGIKTRLCQGCSHAKPQGQQLKNSGRAHTPAQTQSEKKTAPYIHDLNMLPGHCLSQAVCSRQVL